MTEILTPASREEWLAMRKDSVGASEVAAMLGASPWMTPYELWTRKSGIAPPVEETLAMRLGSHDEAFALELLAEERPEWSVVQNIIGRRNVIGDLGFFYRDTDAKLSCTPDALIVKRREQGSAGICQVKTVSMNRFREDWRDEFGALEVPPYVAIQAIQEAALTGATWACAAVLVRGDFHSEFHVVDVPLHVGIAARIRTEVADFWRRVRENDPYPADYGRDGDLIKHIYADDDGGEIDLSVNAEAFDLVARREMLKARESSGNAAEKERKSVDAALIHILGNAARGVLADGRVIEAKTVNRVGYSVDATTYRQVRVRQLKRKVAA
jgi:predicted phage-related endonuclease